MPFGLPSFAELPLLVNLAIMAAAAAVVWYAGTRLARIGDLLSDRTGLGQAIFGAVFLAVATSLPEVSSTVTAASSGNASLAMNGLLGGVVLQTAVLAIGDASFRKGALTFFAPRPVLLLQGTLLIVLLGIALSVIIATELVTIGWVGLGSILVFATYAGSLYLMRNHGPGERWQPIQVPESTDEQEAQRGLTAPYRDKGTLQLFGLFGLATVAVLIAGVVIATAAAAIAEQTGLGQSFVGSTLLAASTSLPEISSSVAAVQIGAYSMAVSNIFGSNSLMVALIFVADLAYTEGPIFEALDRSAIFGAAAAVVATAIYLAGLIERRNVQVWRFGLDSVAMIGFFGVNLAILWILR